MNRFGAVLIRGVIKLFGMLPLKFHYAFTGFIAWMLESVIGYRKGMVYTNLARSFPDWKYRRLREEAHKFYVHMAEVMVEFIWFGGSGLKRIRRSHIVEMDNVGVVVEALKTSPSVTVLYSHCGNWELLGGLPAYDYDGTHENPFTVDNTFVVYRRLSNRLWDEVFKRNRRAPLHDYEGEIESEQVLRHCIKNRDRKSLYCFIADQSPYFTKHDVGMFLNQSTKAMIGSVAVAHKLGHSVVYMNMDRKSRGHYEMSFRLICRDASKEEPAVILRKYFDFLEEDIRNNPSNWLWSHNRWKKY